MTSRLKLSFVSEITAMFLSSFPLPLVYPIFREIARADRKTRRFQNRCVLVGKVFCGAVGARRAVSADFSSRNLCGYFKAQTAKTIVRKQNSFEKLSPKRLLQLSAAGEVLESVLHLFAHILLASFPRYFRKILGNPQRISSVFPFISRKI